MSDNGFLDTVIGSLEGEEKKEDRHLFNCPAEYSQHFQHVEDLKEGDALQLKVGARWSTPMPGETVYVYKVLKDHMLTCEEGDPMYRHDFTALVLHKDRNAIGEYAYDSRYFTKVQEA